MQNPGLNPNNNNNQGQQFPRSHQGYGAHYHMNQDQQDAANWGEVMKYQSDVQRMKDQEQRMRQQELKDLYKQEIEKELGEKYEQKLKEKQVDWDSRKRIEDMNRMIEQKEKESKMAKNQIENQNLKISYDNENQRKNQLRQQKQQEDEFYQDQYRRMQEVARQEQISKHQKKLQQHTDLVSSYQNQKDFEKATKEAEKQMDMHYAQKGVYDTTFARQDKLRNDLLLRIKGGYSVNQQTLQDLQNKLAEEEMKKHELEKNYIEKAAIEKKLREDEQYRRNMEMKKKAQDETNYQLKTMMNEKERQKYMERQQQIEKEQRDLQAKMSEYERQKLLQKQIQDQMREQTRKELDNQMYLKNMQKRNKESLDPIEANLNKGTIGGIKHHGENQSQSSSNFASLPGFGSDYHRQRQEQYLQKSLVNNLRSPARSNQGQGNYQQQQQHSSHENRQAQNPTPSNLFAGNQYPTHLYDHQAQYAHGGSLAQNKGQNYHQSMGDLHNNNQKQNSRPPSLDGGNPERQDFKRIGMDLASPNANMNKAFGEKQSQNAMYGQFGARPTKDFYDLSKNDYTRNKKTNVGGRGFNILTNL